MPRVTGLIVKLKMQFKIGKTFHIIKVTAFLFLFNSPKAMMYMRRKIRKGLKIQIYSNIR